MALFQNTVITKYVNTQDKTKLWEKWIAYKKHFLNPAIQENIKKSKEEQYQGEFLIDLFVNILGYTKNPAPNFNLTTELKNVKDSKKADGAILLGETAIAIIELKSTNTIDLGKIEAQAFGYKNNQPDCVYVITSNFEKLRFYIDNAIEHIEFNLFKLTDKEFEVLYLCLAYQNIKNGIPKKIKEESISQEDAITKKLYKDYSQFKRELYQNMTELNPQYAPLELFKKSQKLLDRFLFLFFAEDRLLLTPNSVRTILSQWTQMKEMDAYEPLYTRYKKFFNYLNTGYQSKYLSVFPYNGGLFAPDEILDAIQIDDALLYNHTLKISEYDFASEVDVNILGHIFENSLDEIEAIRNSTALRSGISEPISKRKKDGVFYTPKYITKYIVENTVGKLCQEKKAAWAIADETVTAENLNVYKAWLLQLTICDPACGSGAFLNEALNFLINEHDYIKALENKLLGEAQSEESAKESELFGAALAPTMENSILENNLFGVDLNEESVEIARLSLWLRTAKPNRKLNDLSNNIKCGNSLIDDPAIAGAKAFDWAKEFPQVFGKNRYSTSQRSGISELSGFDVVIGNPPYGAKISKPDFDFYNEKYETANYKLDTFSLFIEKSMKLIRVKGYIGLIVPYTWLTIQQHLKLRQFILNFDLQQIINLPTKIFADADLDTVINIVRKNNENNSIQIGEIFNGEIQVTGQILIENIKKFDDLLINLNLSNIDALLLEKIQSSAKLTELFDVSQGYIPYRRSDLIKKYGEIEGNKIVDERLWHSDKKESDDFKQEIQGKDLDRYTYKESFQYIKYGKHLAGYVSPIFFESPRILIMEITRGERYLLKACFVEKAFYNTPSIINIISRNNEIEKLKYLLVIINSSLFSWYHKKFHAKANAQTSIPKILINDIRNLPIKAIPLSAQQPFVSKADLMLSLNKDLQTLSQKFQRNVQREFTLPDLSSKLQDWYILTYADFLKELEKQKVKLTLSKKSEWEDYFLSEAQKANEIASQISQTDKEIDQMVYALYELTPEEITIVEKR